LVGNSVIGFNLGEMSMKSKLLTASFLILAALQVACSDDDKGLTQAQICAKNPACWQRYTSPQAVKAIAGQAATVGLPQVANAAQGTNVQPGQVPNTQIVPASISNQDLAKYAQRVNNTMQAMSADPDFHLTNGSNTLLPAGTNYVPNYQPSSSGSSSGAEITVARIQPAQPEPQREPTAAPQEDPNSVFSQPEALGAR
jgi:hypothetical protein